MRRKLISIILSFVAFVVTFYMSLTVRAQFTPPSDTKARLPNVLLLVDTSGSMVWGLDGGNADCKDTLNPKKARYTILGEVLTGTVDDLDCWSGVDPLGIGGPPVPLMSNSERHQPGGQNCVPTLNLDPDILAALQANPLGWPYEVSDKDNSSSIAYCGGKTATKFARCFSTSGWSTRDVCGKATIGWNQAADGLLDTYGAKIRFGMMSFDSLAFSGYSNTSLYSNKPMTWWIPESGVPITYTLDPNCRNGTLGHYCLVYSWPWLYYDTGDWSYWHGTGTTLSSTWLTGTRSATLFPSTSIVAGYTPLSVADIGARNSRALPHKGRLLGFGHPDATITDTVAHNDMVQDAILGLSMNLEHSTPLAALMRDAFEFISNDISSTGVTIPHPTSVSPTLVSIGPKTDPYFADPARCRDTVVLLITDGEPTSDVNDRTAHWASRLALEQDVKTIVFGIGLETARWRNGSTIQTKKCGDLTPNDYSPISSGIVMCTRDGLGWKYADNPLFNLGLTSNDMSAIRACCNLLETAIAGDPTNAYGQVPYFPSDQAQLKQVLDGILKSIAGTTVSRTVPIFANITSTFQSGAAPATYYELRSAMVPSTVPTAGTLERVRYACDSSMVPVQQSVDETKGDRFHKNIDYYTSLRPRRFILPVPLKVGTLMKPMWTVRPGTVVEDGLMGSPSQLGDFVRLDGSSPDLVPPYVPDTGIVADNLQTAINSLGGARPTAAELLNITNTDRATCLSQVGTNSLEDCAKRVLQWYGGSSSTYPLPSGKMSPSRDPNVCGGWDKCGPLGAIYRSNPVIVSPPEPNSAEQSFSSFRSGTTSFYEQQRSRPTMLYAQTIDGILHAFVMSKNAALPDPYGNVSTVDSLENNELWSFIPPAILPQIWPNFKTESRLLDGPIAVGNVVFNRSMTQTAEGMTGASGFRTVLVGSSGYGDTGFYYAVDVTNPTEPRFLWQLVNSVAGGALFGKVLPGAAITTLKVRDPKDGQIKQIGVAILPGGRDPGTPTTSSPRRIFGSSRSPIFTWNGPLGSYAPRSLIRSWGSKVASRSVTIVELETGRIIARMTGEWADNPGKTSTTTCGGSLTGADPSLCGLNPNVIINPSRTSFDSPMTGTPVPFPSGTAQVSTRVYIGDADGTLWRLDLSDPDPPDWTTEIAWDAYNHSSVPNNSLKLSYVVNGTLAGFPLNMSPTPLIAATLGQPIEQPPIVSVDQRGVQTVTLVTGDGESFNVLSPGTVNLLTTFVDDLDANLRFSPTISSTQGISMAFTDGGRVTGPPTLFDGKLFFSYFSPQTATVCTAGKSGWCGVDFLLGNNSTPYPVIDIDPVVPGLDRCATFQNGEVVFGLAINAVPSCVVAEDNFNDQWLAGQYNSYSSSKGLSYQIVMQTSQGGTSENNSTINTTRVALPPPRAKTRLQSWVSVMQ